MIFSKYLYQPKLCAVDFSVDNTKVHGYTKFTRNEQIHVQLSFDEYFRNNGIYNMDVENTTLLLNLMTCNNELVHIEPMTIVDVEEDENDIEFAHCFARLPRLSDIGYDKTGMHKIQVTWRDKNDDPYNPSNMYFWDSGIRTDNSTIGYRYTSDIEFRQVGVPDKITKISEINFQLYYPEDKRKSFARSIGYYLAYHSMGIQMRKVGETNWITLQANGTSAANDILSDMFYYTLFSPIQSTTPNPTLYTPPLSPEEGWDFRYTYISGLPYVSTSVPIEEYRPDRVVAESEVFEIIAHPKRTVLINFKHFKNLLGCQFWSKIKPEANYTNYLFRVEGRFMRELPEFSAPAEEFSTYDNRNIRLSGFPTNSFTVTFGELQGLPRETVMKILLAIQCKYLIINGIPCKLVSGQDELDVVAQYMNGNTIFNLKFQPAENKYISGYENTGLVAGGQFPVLNVEQPPIPEYSS